MLSSYRGNANATSPQASNKPILVEFTSGGGPCTPLSEVPAGTVNGVNPTFTLTQTPCTGSLLLQVNGLIMKPIVAYTIAAGTITFDAGYIPQTGDELYATYQYG